jgi:dTDP-4-dehydrorhamnose 3,5-epimerase
MADDIPKRDAQTVTPDWQSTSQRLIEGVVVKKLPCVEDERGELAEIYREDWGVSGAPVTSVHQLTVRPRKIKGWHMHGQNDDRLFVSMGFVRLVLFDSRTDSATTGAVNTFFLSERNRALVVVPRGVFHAIQNVGEVDALLVSLPTALYDYHEPDKYRLPLKNSLIPFDFADLPGW